MKNLKIYRRRQIITIIICFFTINALSQKTDYIHYNYKNLDANYKIIMPSKQFNQAIKAYKFHPSKLKNYKDSLSVALIDDFNGDWAKTRKAGMQLNYTWQRASYYTWLSEKKLQKFGKKHNINHPYLVKEYILTNKPISIIKRLRKKVFKKTKRNEAKTMPVKKLLKTAFHHHPEVVKNKEAFFKKEREKHSNK